MSDDTLSAEQITEAGLADWRPMLNALHARFATTDFATGLQLVEQIGAAAEAANHHPEIALSYGFVVVHLSSHDSGGITDRDVALARQISDAASGLGVAADPAKVTVAELCLDSPDYAKVLPFWAAVMGYEENGDEVKDGSGLLPTIWFQESGSDDPRQRFHIDVHVDPAQRQARIDAAVAAGGTVVDEAATFTVLADQEGNRVCICV